MDLQQLRAFLAVAEELHFGRAADRLHMAQPPLSRTIRALERELGSKLFDRNTRSVAITASGKALLAPAREVLETVQRAAAAVESAEKGEIGTVKIAFAGLSTHRIVAQIARVVRTRRPGVRLELYSQNFARPAMRKLAEGETDIALGRWDVIPPDISSEVIVRDSLVVAVPAGHEMAGRRRISLDEVADEPFISLPPHEDGVLQDRLHRLARKHGFVADVVQLAPDTQTALALVSAQVGCLLTLASVADNASLPHLAFIDLDEDAPEVDLHAAWRSTDESPALRSVLDTVLELASRDWADDPVDSAGS